MLGIPTSCILQNTNLLLLTTADRAHALENAAQLARLSKLADKVDDWIPSGLSRLAACCADACLEENAKKSWQADIFKHFSFGDTWERDDALVVSISETSEALDGVCAVADALGAGGFQPINPEQLAAFLDTLNQARDLIDSLPEFREVVSMNTGLIVPFLCKPPSVGSGSAVQMPGVLLLPADVPPVVLAECWIHESLHTELHLAEWLEGVPPGSSTEDLPTPWRTVKRPASLLLHGSYVFSSLLKFMNSMKVMYSQVGSEWFLSATRGVQIPVNNVKETIEFRKKQIIDAMDCLNRAASFTPYGKIAVARIHENMLANNPI